MLGFLSISGQEIVMLIVGIVLLYLAVHKKYEPLLLVPIGFGCILANIPLAGISDPNGFLGIIYAFGIKSGLFPILIFIGIGAWTDFSPLIAHPITGILGLAAQIGIFLTIGLCLLVGKLIPGLQFSLQEAASIGIIGGADGPTTIYLASRLAPQMISSVAVVAYSYMALVPIIQPPIMRLLTSEKERKIVMHDGRELSQTTKLIFPVATTLVTGLLIPDAAPLVGALMFGNFLKESKVCDRLVKASQNELLNLCTIMVGLSVGGRLTGETFLTFKTVTILVMGIFAFAAATAGGVLMAKLINVFRPNNPINPLIGAAGVSAVPMAARVAHLEGQKADPCNFLLMHAMGPNVAGVIGSAMAAGVLLALLK